MLISHAELGGNKDQYGMMLSVAYLAMFLMTSVYGKWIDSNGNKFTMPYIASFVFGITSYTIYFLAILIPPGPIAVYTLMFSRFLEGMSVAGRTLSYSWVHSMIPHDKQKTVLTILSMSRTIGSIVGPITNLLVSGINTQFDIGGVTIPVNPNNSIGLLMVGSEVFLLILTLIFLLEPPDKKDNEAVDVLIDKDNKKEDSEKIGLLYVLGHLEIWYVSCLASILYTIQMHYYFRSLTNADLFFLFIYLPVRFPIFAMFCVITNFSVFITAFAPVAKHAMKWDAVQISKISAVGSAVTFCGMLIAIGLSMRDIPDRWMINFGFTSFAVGGSFMYYNWTENTTYWKFAAPAYVLFFSYPFIGPSCRSVYSKGIHSHPELNGSVGMMMGLMNQAVAFGGMVAPTIVAVFILRSPDDVDADPYNKNELNAGALYVPILSAAVVTGLAYQYYFYVLPGKKKKAKEEADSGGASESSKLLGGTKKNGTSIPRASILEISDAFSRSSEVSRRLSFEISGIAGIAPNPFDTKDEKEYFDKLWKDRQELLKFNKMMDDDDIEK